MHLQRFSTPAGASENLLVNLVEREREGGCIPGEKRVTFDPRNIFSRVYPDARGFLREKVIYNLSRRGAPPPLLTNG